MKMGERLCSVVMARLKIYKDNYVDSTVVSNRFIDEYMKDAFRRAKVMLSPITPANFELERAVTLLLSEKGIRCNKPKKKKKAQKSASLDAEKAVNPKVKRRKRKKQSNAKSKEIIEKVNMEEKAE